MYRFTILNYLFITLYRTVPGYTVHLFSLHSPASSLIIFHFFFFFFPPFFFFFFPPFPPVLPDLDNWLNVPWLSNVVNLKNFNVLFLVSLDGLNAGSNCNAPSSVIVLKDKSNANKVVFICKANRKWFMDLINTSYALLSKSASMLFSLMSKCFKV